MIASSQKQRAGPRDGRSVLHQRAVHQLDAPTFPLHRGLNLHRLEQHRTQQVDREPSGLKLGIDSGSLYPPTQQAADDLAAHCRTPRSSRHFAW
jgi:activator of 2-hydroxyglutaryl-CoA dehydratase